MAEGKDYITRMEELGNVCISEEVLAAIAGAAAVEVDGVSGLGNGIGSDLSVAMSRKQLSRGVRLAVEDDRACVDISIMVKYGYVIPEVAKEVQEAVTGALENTSGFQVVSVNVSVAGIDFQK